ncbi:MAG: hypothetical protein ACAI43_19795, partial [Phycisphaerae bacterium]
VNGAVTVANGGKLAPGNGPGDLTVGSLALGPSAITDIQIGGTVLGSQYDSVDTLTGGSLAFGGALNVVDFGAFDVSANSASYQIFTLNDGPLGGLSATDFASVMVDGNALTNAAGVWSFTGGGTEYVFTQGTGVLSVTAAVPEPAGLGLVAVAALFGFRRTRRA